MFEYCSNEIKGIQFIFITKCSNDLIREQLKDRYKLAKTLSGTRGYHHFQPINKYQIEAQIVSEQINPSTRFDFQKDEESIDKKFAISDYVSVLYDEKAWIGIIQDIDSVNQDCKVMFYHPPYPSRSYYWPKHEDLLWVPNTDVLLKIDTPVTATGRQYHIKDTDRKKIQDELDKKLKS